MKKRALVVLLLASLLLSLGFAASVPLNHNPDEASHRDYIHLMVEQKGLVAFVPPPGRAPLPEAVLARIEAREGMRVLPEQALSRDEAHQPPLYYALAAVVFALSGGSLLALRLVALPFHLATVWVAWRAGKDLFPARPELPLALAAFVAFLPTQAQLAAAVSNDATTHFFCALIVWRAARLLAPNLPAPVPLREGARLGVFFGLGLLTKMTVLQLYPVLLVLLILAVHARRRTVREAVSIFGTALVVGLSLAAPWFVRNVQLYGDPLAQTIYVATGPNPAPEQIAALMGGSADYARSAGLRSFVSFWYFLDPSLPVVPLARFIGPPEFLLLALTLALVPLGALYLAKKRAAFAEGEGTVLAAMVLVPLCLLPFFIRFLYTVFQAQGRYLLPGLLAVGIVCTYGFGALGKRGLVFLPAALLLLLSLWQLAHSGYVATR